MYIFNYHISVVNYQLSVFQNLKCEKHYAGFLGFEGLAEIA